MPAGLHTFLQPRTTLTEDMVRGAEKRIKARILSGMLSIPGEAELFEKYAIAKQRGLLSAIRDFNIFHTGSETGMNEKRNKEIQKLMDSYTEGTLSEPSKKKPKRKPTKAELELKRLNELTDKYGPIIAQQIVYYDQFYKHRRDNLH